MAWIGGDLAAMHGLAQRFLTTGEACQTHARAVVGRAGATVATFTDEMRRLDVDARALDTDIGQRLTALRAQADATVWSGANRTRQDELLATYEADIVGLRGALDAFLVDAGAVVGGALTTTLDQFQRDVETTAVATVTAAEAFSAGVERQRSAFDAVMNGAI